mmetsp:Transcript_31664/g.104935  ORF Transcript_31664/g.104935 Transcript_31664/m.104935 type:complete len:219 (+) Transcript_31664:485-1141(+)
MQHIKAVEEVHEDDEEEVGVCIKFQAGRRLSLTEERDEPHQVPCREVRTQLNRAGCAEVVLDAADTASAVIEEEHHYPKQDVLQSDSWGMINDEHCVPNGVANEPTERCPVAKHNVAVLDPERADVVGVQGIQAHWQRDAKRECGEAIHETDPIVLELEEPQRPQDVQPKDEVGEVACPHTCLLLPAPDDATEHRHRRQDVDNDRIQRHHPPLKVERH